jgi:hypothetical protein
MLYCLSHSTDNVGDDIQALAAQQFYPSVDAYVDRDNLRRDLRTEPPGKLLLSGWFYAHRWFSKQWPPPVHMSSLCVSLHIRSGERARAIFSQEDSCAYLRRCGVIGARDIHTRDLLRSTGVESDFSGCLTALLSSEAETEDGLIVLCDPMGGYFGREWQDPLRSMPFREKLQTYGDRIERVTHRIPRTLLHEQRLDHARRLLHLYDRASLVITSRLHCALPCIAMGTPVVFVSDDPDDPRFTGYEDLLHPVSTQQLSAGEYSVQEKLFPEGMAEGL